MNSGVVVEEVEDDIRLKLQLVFGGHFTNIMIVVNSLYLKLFDYG
jgi:hypothetical protein